MKIHCYAILLITLFMMSACNPGVDEEPDIRKLVSVNSFISPQDTMLVAYAYHVQRFGTITDPETAVVNDALIIMSGDDTADTLVFNETLNRYEAKPKNLIIQANHSYSLRVKLVNGESLFATCLVPNPPDFPEVHGIRKAYDYVFQINWTNTFNHPFVAAAVSGTGTYELETPRGIFTVPVSARLDGISFVLAEQRAFNAVTGLAWNAYRSPSPGLIITLRNLDINMYKFYETFRKLDDWKSNNDDGGLPNFREQQSLYSNITNGVGIFGAFNTTTATKAIK